MSGAILLLHAWWGLNQDVLAYAARLRGEGYEVVAPDLYRGEIATTIERATMLRDALDAQWQRALDEIDRALSELLQREKRVAIVGWSLGAGYAWQLARNRASDITGLVVYYGLGGIDADTPLPPILGHFAENDPYEPLPDVQNFAKRLREGSHSATFHVYPGTTHWFDEPSRPEYDADASALAWTRTRAFLEERLQR